ncbi:3-phosphoshikimate 1-carboxyvinyltransferase [Candidatus Pelagibacter sp.]|nr:3-phosphoshikimate 1-carboxyvinyltransferase [Candidatus Pelagibacter sp.]
MTTPLIVKKQIKTFNKTISVNGDKSLSIRWALLASQASGKSRAYNLLRSLDVLSALNCLKKLGIKVSLKNKYCEIEGKGLNGFKIKKNVILNAGNSGTLARLILGLLVHHKSQVKIIGDKSLSKRDFSRVIIPLKKFGAKFSYKSNYKLPINICGIANAKPIKYNEIKGSAQCKSAVMLAALNTKGETVIKAKKSRDHTEILFKHLKIPIELKRNKDFDLIKVKGQRSFSGFNYKIPSDISSSAFFIILTTLSKKSQLTIKNVNINPSRIGVVTILKRMGAKIEFKNKKKYMGEQVADIFVKSADKIKPINCPKYLNSQAIDEFLLIFLVASKANGVSYFKEISELNEKESPRLILGSKILNMMGIKTILTNNSIKIYGDPKLEIKHNIEIKNYLKDHRIFMMSMIAALSIGGNWKLHDQDAIKTSFPSFLNLIKKIQKNSK